MRTRAYYHYPVFVSRLSYSSEAQNGIKKILKNGTHRGARVQRTEKHEDGCATPRSYDAFAPIAYVNQSGTKLIPEEVINRSITITMVRSNDPAIPINLDLKELEEIRNELYTLKLMWMADPGLIGFDKIYEEALEELQSPNGVDCDGVNVIFSSRCREIVATMYTVGKMSHNESAILHYFYEMQSESENEECDTDSGRVFAALMKIVDSSEVSKLYQGDVYKILEDITTFEVAREYENILSNEGELSCTSRVPTRIVTNILKDLGFKFKRGRENKSVFSNDDLETVFQSNLLRFGSKNQIETYSRKLTKTVDKSCYSVVNPMCQTYPEVNKLTANREVC